MITEKFTKKYALFLTSIAAFALIAATVLTFNFVKSSQIDEISLEINLAGRQRMLSQRMVKALYQIQSAGVNYDELERAKKELKLTFNLFDRTLQAFNDGGSTIGADKSNVYLDKVQAANEIQIMADAYKIWTPYKSQLSLVMNAPIHPDATLLEDTLIYANANNLQLLKLMNDLTNSLERKGSSEGAALQTIQVAGVSLLLVNIGFIIFLFVTKVSKSDKAIAETAYNLEKTNKMLENNSEELAESLTETDLILGTVTQGLFLLDDEYRVGSKYSLELENIFHIENMEGINFASLLQRILTEKQYLTARDYLELLFNPAKKEKQLIKINPLNKIEVNFPNRGGGFAVRYLDFTFRRLIKDGKVQRLFVGVSDITDQQKLEAQLRDSEGKKDRQMALLLDVIHANPVDVKAFINESLADFDSINDVLRPEEYMEGSSAKLGINELQAKLDKVFRIVHAFKGNASVLPFSFFVKASHEFEEKIVKLKHSYDLKAEDFLNLVLIQAKVIDDLKEAKELVSTLNLAERVLQEVPEAPSTAAVAPEKAKTKKSVKVSLGESKRSASKKNFFDSYQKLLSAEAEKLDKQVFVKWEGLQMDELLEHDALVKDILIQLGRNSVAHGLETAEERVAKQKDTTGVITIKCEKVDNTLALSFQDDGAGLPFAKISEQAVKQGLVSEDDARFLMEDEIAVFIFEPGFSTYDGASTLAGRGVGLDLIKEKVIDQLQGSIDLDTAMDKFTRFSFELPLKDSVTADV